MPAAQGSWALGLRSLAAVHRHGVLEAFGLAINVIHVGLDGGMTSGDLGTLYAAPGTLRIERQVFDYDGDDKDEFISRVSTYVVLPTLPQSPRATVWSERGGKVIPYTSKPSR